MNRAIKTFAIPWRERKVLSASLSRHIGLSLVLFCAFAAAMQCRAQDDSAEKNSAGYVPVISGGAAYIQTARGGAQTLTPEIIPLLLVPMGHSLLIESRVEFTGFFQREDGTSGRYAGKVFKTIDFAQLDWLANTHTTVVAGRYILPFGLFSERLASVWIRNLQDSPLTYSIGTHPDGAGNGLMLRGVAASTASHSIQYSAYMSAHNSIDQLPAMRVAGGDTSIFFPAGHVETGVSYQRSLEGFQINSEAAYLSWQPQRASVDLKAEYDRNHYGHGYWIEAAHSPQQFFVAPDFFRHFQLVGRMEQLFTRNGGGHGFSSVNEQRPEVGVNYLIHDDWRLVSSYGRLFSANGNTNIWNFGFTYRFVWPLWPGRKS